MPALPIDMNDPWFRDCGDGTRKGRLELAAMSDIELTRGLIQAGRNFDKRRPVASTGVVRRL